MSRSLKVKKEYIEKVKLAVQRNGYPRQKDLAEDLNLALATIGSFLNGRPVDHLNFGEICNKLGLDWQVIAQLEGNLDQSEPVEEQEFAESNLYIERIPYEEQCYEAILKSGALIRVKATQQMGKTLLIEKVLSQARQQGYQTLNFNFQLADSTVFSDLRKFLQWFCACVGQQLGIPNQLAESWDDIFGCNNNATEYFRRYLLPKIDNSLILVLDKVDLVFEHSTIAEDFCKLLRGWYDIARRGDNNSILWKKLRLVVVHSTEVYSSLNINHSPLSGIGLVVELPEFNLDEVQDLAQRHGINWNADQVQPLMNMVGGHPYLIKLALDHISRGDCTLEDLLRSAPTEAGIYIDHLRRHLNKLNQNPDLMSAFKKVVQANNWLKIEANQVFKLHSMGLVKLQGNEVMPRCDLYHQYFRDCLKITL